MTDAAAQPAVNDGADRPHGFRTEVVFRDGAEARDEGMIKAEHVLSGSGASASGGPRVAEPRSEVDWLSVPGVVRLLQVCHRKSLSSERDFRKGPC